MNDEPLRGAPPSVLCSVIVPSYQSEATIGACLTSLVSQAHAPAYEIIVVDSSRDRTSVIVAQHFPQVHLIHLAQQTDPAQARNLGAAQARGQILAFIDSDCTADSNWLALLCATLAHGYDAVGGVIVNANRDTVVSRASYMCEFREFLPGGRPRDVDNLTLGNTAYLRAAWERAGGFPTGCFPQEDQVFHQTFRALGFRIRLDPYITVAHTHRSERAAFLRHQRQIGVANARVLRRIALPGSTLAQRPGLAALVLPALVLIRLLRTLYACRTVERALFREPALVWLCLVGMCWWGCGFLEGTTAP